LTAGKPKGKLTHKKFSGSWINDDIICFHYFEDAEVNLSDVHEIVRFQKVEGVNKEHCRLVIAEKFASVTKEAREYIQQHTPDVKAEAYVFSQLSQRILFKLYTKMRKHSHPIKQFDNQKDAIYWLKSFS